MGLSGSTSTTGTSGNQAGVYGSTQQGQNQNQLSYLDPSYLQGQEAAGQGQQARTADATGAANAAAGGTYASMLADPGYSDATKTAISQTSNDAENEKLAEANHNLQMHGASTGNDAGFAGATANLYGTAAGDQAARVNANQVAFANEAERQKELAASGMQQLLGINQAANLGYMGQGNQLAQLLSGTSSTSSNQTQGTTGGQTTGTSTTTGGGASAGSPTGGVGGLLCQLFNIGCPSTGGGTCTPACVAPQTCVSGKCVDPAGGKGPGSPAGGSGTGPGSPGQKPDPVKGCNDGQQPNSSGVCPGATGGGTPPDECGRDASDPDYGNPDCSGTTTCPPGQEMVDGVCQDGSGGGSCADEGLVDCPDGSCASDADSCGGGGGGDCSYVCPDGSCGDEYGCDDGGGGGGGGWD